MPPAVHPAPSQAGRLGRAVASTAAAATSAARYAASAADPAQAWAWRTCGPDAARYSRERRCSLHQSSVRSRNRTRRTCGLSQLPCPPNRLGFGEGGHDHRDRPVLARACSYALMVEFLTGQREAARIVPGHAGPVIRVPLPSNERQEPPMPITNIGSRKLWPGTWTRHAATYQLSSGTLDRPPAMPRAASRDPPPPVCRGPRAGACPRAWSDPQGAAGLREPGVAEP